ncbi:MAG: multidrug ABC transporter substrate-binding protein [Nitrospira sp. SG-bin2]|jgi:putative ABC transport system permease protein|uniref:ABC transporter permease n=1 Tax=Nitrospira cf. moscoviensis SBR1015 TaxID=96242 RepID=UPI000A0D4E9B|nr:ABC transporter permease [Nitrospira cf. moscoviensis SBR1015]OQW36368.1 MAG: multidrug ABC transporter substrate-binding protein [Nitrospira sp. SG-bin2]
MPAFVLLTVLTAIRILSRNRLRAGLTMLGIVIGVGAVIAMVSIGEGAKAAVAKRVASMGTNVIMVLPGSMTTSGVRGGQGGAVTLTISDGMELKKRIPMLSEVGWGKRDTMQIINGNKNWSGLVNGISPSYLTIRDWSFSSGGAFTQQDVDTADRVALVGQTVVENLFDVGEEPVGAIIRIKNVPFRVIGVLSPKGQSSQGSDQDDIIFIPFSTAERKVFGTQFLGSVGALFASTERLEDLAPAAAQIRDVIRARHRLQPDQEDDFTIRTQVDIGKVQESTSETLTVMLFAIASVSLLVGGIGIMNILLVSVTERTREIGVRMAVGAKRRHIVMQFLIEAVTLSVAGGCLGILAGILGARVTTAIAGWPTIISAETVMAAFVFSIAVGLFFGLYPANKAARLNPIDALRYE